MADGNRTKESSHGLSVVLDEICPHWRRVMETPEPTGYWELPISRNLGRGASLMRSLGRPGHMDLDVTSDEEPGHPRGSSTRVGATPSGITKERERPSTTRRPGKGNPHPAPAQKEHSMVKEAFRNLKVQPYDGQGDLSIFMRRITRAIEAYDLDGPDAIDYFLMHLTEKVQLKLPPSVMRERDFKIFLSEVEIHLAPKSRSQLARADLKGCRQEKGESYEALGERVRALTRRAYPEARGAMLDSLGADYFVSAIHEGTIRHKVRDLSLDTLEDSVLTAERLQAAARMESGGTRVRSAAAFEEQEGPKTRSSASDTPRNTGQKEGKPLEELVRDLQKQVAELSSKLGSRKNGKGGRRQPAQEVQCWHCGQYGHYQSRCPRKVGRGAPGRARCCHPASIPPTSVQCTQGNGAAPHQPLVDCQCHGPARCSEKTRSQPLN